ncbi:hypothetical protein [Chryseobacterium cucumeris]|uniref:hypothetical protein n=1 Tax=Chryseobacterium cucumeris TaxID=1813611 RepID=UPI003D984F64
MGLYHDIWSIGETYLLVPIVKNNRVVLLIEAVREKDKVYFYQKEDKGLIVFFQAIIFDKITDFNEKISIQERREERTIGNVNVGCTTRSITVGCNDNEPNCVPYTRTETICPPKYGNNPPKAFDPIGLDGGGGGDGYNYPDPPENETPCEKAKKIGNNAKTQDLFEGLKTKTNSTKEFGQVLKESAGQINNTQVEGEANQAGIDFNVSGKFDGFIHSHYSGLLSIFSANDLASLAAIYINGGMSNVNNFIFGVVTASGTQYILIIDDPEKFAIFAKQFLLPNGQIDQVYTDSYGNGIYIMYNIKNNGLSSANELGFVKLLSNENTGLKVFKGSNNSTNWAELGLKNGQLDSKPCNN